MFFNPDDVRWFKPVELWTKSGRRGRMTEPLGTHGAFKARFDGPVSQVSKPCSATRPGPGIYGVCTASRECRVCCLLD